MSRKLQDLTDLWSGRVRLLPSFSKFPLKEKLNSVYMQQHCTNAFTAMCRVITTGITGKNLWKRSLFL